MSNDPQQEEPEKARLHAIVDGSVQGVGFRMFVKDLARTLKLTGWVRNKFDGRVEVLAEGTHADLERLIDKLRTGPRSAFVSEFQKEWQPATGEFSSFDIRRTD
jgi:acylphosphatase